MIHKRLRRIKQSDDLKVLKIWVQPDQLLGNHTFSHTDLNQVAVSDYIKDIEKNHKLLVQLMNEKITITFAIHI